MVSFNECVVAFSVFGICRWCTQDWDFLTVRNGVVQGESRIRHRFTAVDTRNGSLIRGRDCVIPGCRWFHEPQPTSNQLKGPGLPHRARRYRLGVSSPLSSMIWSSTLMTLRAPVKQQPHCAGLYRLEGSPFSSLVCSSCKCIEVFDDQGVKYYPPQVWRNLTIPRRKTPVANTAPPHWTSVSEMGLSINITNEGSEGASLEPICLLYNVIIVSKYNRSFYSTISVESISSACHPSFEGDASSSVVDRLNMSNERPTH